MNDSKFIKKKIAELEEELAKLRSASSEEEYFLKRSKEQIEKLNRKMLESKDRNFHTVETHGLYCNEERNRLKSQTLPIFSTPTGGGYDSLVDGSLLLSYKTINDPNKIYSRIDNTTVDHLAMKLAALEGVGIPEITQGLVTS